MIDPRDSAEVQVAKQRKIIEALIARSERGHDIGTSAYSLFQSAIALQGAVWEKTKDLERALDTLGRASNELELAQRSQEQMQRHLADAMVAVEGGFALFSDGKLQVCNDLFRKLLPDISNLIEPGLEFDDYLSALENSKYHAHPPTREPGSDPRFSSQVVALKNDRWFQITFRQTGSGNIAVLQTEITEIVRENRREKDRLIDQQAHLLQAAFDHIALGICTFSADGELLIRNERFGEMLGVPLSLLKKGTHFRRIVEYVERLDAHAPESGRRGSAAWEAVLRRGGAVQERYRRTDGMCLDLRVHLLPDEGFIVSIMDVTTETEAAEERQRINQTLEQRVRERTIELTEANRQLRVRALEQARIEEALRVAKETAEAAHTSKTRFLAAASHDLLQPINAAKLYTSALRETVHHKGAADTIERLGRSLNSIDQLLHALLDISRLDSPGAEFNVTNFCINDTLRSIEGDLAPLACEKGIRLDVVPSSKWVRSDQRYLMRSIRNLVVNAIQYTDSGRVIVGCRASRGKLRVEVWDTGVGITKADQTRIFNEFTRVASSRHAEGMGLGLSIVERACRHLGHKVGLRSKPGIGSVFSLELPLAPAGPARQAEPAEAAENGALDLIVMMIENDPAVLHATTQNLENWGASVLGTSNTADALQLMDEIGTPPDIILADYQLDDGKTGIEAIHALRKASGIRIPAIIVTANRSKALVNEGAEIGVSVLTKPVQLPRLRALIDWKTRAEVA